jgi:hypothetical protein
VGVPFNWIVLLFLDFQYSFEGTTGNQISRVTKNPKCKETPYFPNDKIRNKNYIIEYVIQYEIIH